MATTKCRQMAKSCLSLFMTVKGNKNHIPMMMKTSCYALHVWTYLQQKILIGTWNVNKVPLRLFVSAIYIFSIQYFFPFI